MIRRWGILAAACAAFMGWANAQVGSVGAAESESPSHAWLVIPNDNDVSIGHVPPREAAGMANAAPGFVRPVRSIRETPEAIAGIGDRVLLVFGPTRADSRAIRRVLTLRSVPAGVSGLWTDLPSDVFGVAPSLPGAGRLVDLAVSGGRNASVYALMARDGELSLRRLTEEAWEPVDLPPEVGAGAFQAALVSHGPGVLFAVRGSGETRAWAMGPDGSWTPVGLADWETFWNARWRRGFGREVVTGTPGDGGTEIRSVTPEGSWSLGRVDAPADAAPVVLASSDRLVLVGRVEDGAVHVWEMSLNTGRIIHAGPVQHRAPISVGEFRLIVAMMLGVMVTALVVIIRPSGDATWTVPDGFVLADPGRRLIATVLDVLLMAWTVAPAFGVTVREIITLQVVVMEGQAWLVVPAIMVGGALAMGVWEGLLGFSPGKFLVGLRVYRAKAGEPEKLGVFWGLVRATIKWMVPPVAMVALVDREGRHRGDAAARAAVVMRGVELVPDGEG